MAGWSPLGFDPLVKRPSSFETGPPESALLYDELVVMDQRRVALKYALVVERVEKALGSIVRVAVGSHSVVIVVGVRGVLVRRAVAGQHY